jgi:phosphonate transport system permease protein
VTSTESPVELARAGGSRAGGSRAGGSRADGPRAVGPAAPVRARRRWPLSAGRTWTVVLALAVLWSVWESGIGRPDTVNVHGWPLMREFWVAAARPELGAEFLATTARATLTTVAFALLGTALAVLIGLCGGVLLSEAFWRTGPQVRRSVRIRRGLAWWSSRLALGLPRGVHEAVWGLFLVMVLGRDPIVGVLAIGIPFGAITAKVYAEILDESAPGAYAALVTAGAGRLAALAYGVLPRSWPDLVSYGFYRFDCAIRSAVILGMIGAGGLGFQLALSFQALRYEQMWTLVYALVLVGAVVDRWGAALRSGASRRTHFTSLVLGAGLTVGAAVVLGPDLGRLLDSRTWTLLAGVARAAFPPTLPGTWADLVRDSLATVQISLFAIALASLLAVLTAYVAARGAGGPLRTLVAGAARLVLLFTRAVSPPVWALLFLFVLLPGPLPGAVALGVYNFGVLGRLFAEVVENLDRRPAAALREAGAGAVAAFLYATVPMSTTKFAAYALYRWEIAIRETVVVGVVGAAGLGRLLEERRVAFDYPGMLTVVIALVVLSFLVDSISVAARRAWR